jgi:hypothetical protein
MEKSNHHKKEALRDVTEGPGNLFHKLKRISPSVASVAYIAYTSNKNRKYVE